MSLATASCCVGYRLPPVKRPGCAVCTLNTKSVSDITWKTSSLCILTVLQQVKKSIYALHVSAT